jgi:hypothetical protein
MMLPNSARRDFSNLAARQTRSSFDQSGQRKAETDWDEEAWELFRGKRVAGLNNDPAAEFSVALIDTN